jgi:hypothetical protein
MDRIFDIQKLIHLLKLILIHLMNEMYPKVLRFLENKK